jgi:hypothetical protein
MKKCSSRRPRLSDAHTAVLGGEDPPLQLPLVPQRVIPGGEDAALSEVFQGFYSNTHLHLPDGFSQPLNTCFDFFHR